ncbi:MaoC family dehydratase [Solimonas terrae]|uniref:Acyl dehydratase n=1 Tax=Solimonas terrae TaxID=1396819 RepID=A0A6M2BTI3_9GAMM|nr:MaoC/PaaZ C-terminal domain-containing protein [Solimonas terrae]NGY05423.1 acyl dehydratase [Solimonas terrae]
MNTTLARMPSAEGLYLKAATTILRKPKGKPKLPQLGIEVKNVRVSGEQLAEYRKVCGFADSHHLPITFPHVMAAALHLQLMTDPKFPLPLLGLVHVRNHIRQQRGLGSGESYDFDVRLGDAREVRQGLEFDINTSVTVDGEEVWSEVMTTLFRMPAPKQGARPAPQAAVASLSDYIAVSASADTGRRYAKVGKDFNPIHLAPFTARLFGFKRHIAHGMWSAAYCAALLADRIEGEPAVLDVQFRQPLFLPGRAALKFDHGAGAGTKGRGIDFALLASRSDKVHLTGVLR